MQLGKRVITNHRVGTIIARRRYIPSDEPNVINSYPETNLLYAVQFSDNDIDWLKATELIPVDTWED